MSITRASIPKKAKDRDVVTWRFTTYNDLDADQARAVAATLLDGTKMHSLIQAYAGFGTTVFEGDYWASKGRGKDLTPVARLWEQVEAALPGLIVDGLLEYRYPEALRDELVETEVNPALGLQPNS